MGIKKFLSKKIVYNQNIKLWKSAKKRYEQIQKIVDLLNEAIRDEGLKKGNKVIIPSCEFCIRFENNCQECEWGKIFGICEEENSRWQKLNNKLYDISNNISKIIEDIDKEIANK